MLRKELIKRSPLRILEKSTHGGLVAGEAGIFASRHGAGKTACLVHIAVDQLIQNKHIIHISFSDQADNISTWYEDIFTEISKTNNLDNVMQIHDEIIHNRIIMNFSQDGIHINKIEKSISDLIEKANFSADTIIIDGYNFKLSSREEIRQFKLFAKKYNCTLWFSESLDDKNGFFDGNNIPEVLCPIIDEIDIIIGLQPCKDHIHLNLLKDHDTEICKDLHLELDPTTLLIAME